MEKSSFRWKSYLQLVLGVVVMVAMSKVFLFSLFRLADNQHQKHTSTFSWSSSPILEIRPPSFRYRASTVSRTAHRHQFSMFLRAQMRLPPAEFQMKKEIDGVSHTPSGMSRQTNGSLECCYVAGRCRDLCPPATDMELIAHSTRIVRDSLIVTW